MTYDQTSSALNAELQHLSPTELPIFLTVHASEFSEHPFTDFMRLKFREKGISQKDVFIAADFDDRTGYKLISGEKRTKKRDAILRICLAAEFSLEETQTALVLYGMAPLHGRVRRDAAFIVAFCNRIYEIHDVDKILRDNDLPPFLTADQLAGNY